MLNSSLETKPKIHFISQLYPTNVADMNFNPLQHFKGFLSEYSCIRHRWDCVDYLLISPTDWVIIGGGDLFDCNISNRTLNWLLSWTNGRVISWGCGYNIQEEFPIIPPRKDKFALFTTRDYNISSYFGRQERYLPCVSCMLTGLENNGNNLLSRKIGIVEHKTYPIAGFMEYDKIDNSLAVEQVLEFIRSSEIILTNSYHVTYWSTLMNKRVIVIQKYASKFYYLKSPPVEYSGDLVADIGRAVTYPNALSECRKLNMEFYGEVIKLIQNDKRDPGGMLLAFNIIFEKLRGKRAAVKGAGLSTKMLLKLLEGYFSPVCICSEESIPGFNFRYDVVKDSELERYDVDVIVIASYKWRKDMMRDIENLPHHYDVFDIFNELAGLGIDLVEEFYDYKSCEKFMEANL